MKITESFLPLTGEGFQRHMDDSWKLRSSHLARRRAGRPAAGRTAAGRAAARRASGDGLRSLLGLLCACRLRAGSLGTGQRYIIQLERLDALFRANIFTFAFLSFFAIAPD